MWMSHAVSSKPKLRELTQTPLIGRGLVKSVLFVGVDIHAVPQSKFLLKLTLHKWLWCWQKWVFSQHLDISCNFQQKIFLVNLPPIPLKRSAKPPQRSMKTFMEVCNLLVCKTCLKVLKASTLSLHKTTSIYNSRYEGFIKGKRCLICIFSLFAILIELFD